MKTKIGRLEAQVLAYSQMREMRVVRSGDLLKPLGLNVSQERKVLSRLSKAGMIVRVWRGVYLMPPRLPLGGKWSPGEWLALDTLMSTVKGRYQVCGPNAFNRYGFDEQVPNCVYVYNNRLSGERQVGRLSFICIKVSDERLGDTETFRIPEGIKVVCASRARTLMDAVYDWSRFDGIPRAYEWIVSDLKAGRVRAEDLVRSSVRYGDKGTIRRVGFLLDREGVAEELLCKLERALTPTTSPIPWIPRKPKRGSINKRWGVVDNIPERY